MIDAKDTEFIKVITGVRRSGKSKLLLMFKDYLLKNNVSEDNIIHINFESAAYDEIKNADKNETVSPIYLYDNVIHVLKIVPQNL